MVKHMPWFSVGIWMLDGGSLTTYRTKDSLKLNSYLHVTILQTLGLRMFKAMYWRLICHAWWLNDPSERTIACYPDMVTLMTPQDHSIELGGVLECKIRSSTIWPWWRIYVFVWMRLGIINGWHEWNRTVDNGDGTVNDSRLSSTERSNSWRLRLLLSVGLHCRCGGLSFPSAAMPFTRFLFDGAPWNGWRLIYAWICVPSLR